MLRPNLDAIKVEDVIANITLPHAKVPNIFLNQELSAYGTRITVRVSRWVAK